MMARPRVKLTLGILGGVLVLLLLVAVLVPLLVPRDRLRALAETQLREQTGGEVTLGELSLRVFPRLKLVLGESSLAVTGDGLRQAGQDPGPLVSGALNLERLDVDLALWPLLKKQVEIGEVSLVKPRLELVTRPAEEAPVEGGGPAAEPAGKVDPGVGLALAAVAVRDGELIWREEETGRAVTVRGWQQDLEAPALGVLMARLQRLGGADAPADAVAGDVALKLDARVAAVELVGFGENPAPPLEDLHLRARLTAPPAADRVNFEIAELSLPGLTLSANGGTDGATVQLTELSLSGGEAVQLSGTVTLTAPPLGGPLRADLAGKVDLALIMDHFAPYLPPRAEDAAPLPGLTGSVDVELAANLNQAPPLSDAPAWQERWREGFDGTVVLEARSGPLTVTDARLGEPLNLASATVISDLHVATGRTAVTVTGARYPGLDADAQAEFTLPPASGPLQADVRGKVDLAPFMVAVQPFLPPREPDAAPLPDLDGRLEVTADVLLKSAPALSDTAAWAAAFAKGLAGRADLEATGKNLTVTSAQLGEPLRVGALTLTSDLRSRAGHSRFEFTGVQHPGLQGDVVAKVAPETPSAPLRVELDLPLLDLDALAALAEASKNEQARAGFSLVSTAWAAEPAKPLVGELIPPDLSLDLDAKVRELRFLETTYNQVDVGGTLRERVIDVTRLDARLGSGHVNGTARVDYAADPGGHATWDVKVTDAPASLIMKPYLKRIADYWTGNLSATAKGNCNLADPEAILNSLTIDGDVEGREGTIDMRQPLAGVSQYLGQRQDLLQVRYAKARKHFAVQDGKVIVTGLNIDGKDTDWTGGGWIGLDGTLDMNISVRLPAGYTPNLGDMSFLADALRDDEGRIGLDFGLTGPTQAPAVKLKLDPAALMNSDAVQDKVEDEVKKGLGGLLDRLKGK